MTKLPDAEQLAGILVVDFFAIVFRNIQRINAAARANGMSSLNTVRNVELADTYLAMAEEQVSTALKAESERM